ncbi:MAG: FAD-binding oxidoreductase, partial [Gemmatimonadota bacterium]|nr:FAD-binding oxidoreductase [Gemmatimonadota bacterium]
MLDRRAFLKIAGATPAWFAACAGGSLLERVPSSTGSVVNDVHSGLNSTPVSRLLRPASNIDVRRAILAARERGARLSISGSRHAMGGQQFLRSGWMLDLRGLDRIVSFDPDRGHLTVGAGARWPRVLEFLATTRGEDGAGWTIVQKPVGVDEVTVGGSLASNVHGMALGRGPIVADVERFAMIGATGDPRIVTREENSDLFRLAIGGYGLFGPIVEVTLRLRERVKVRKIVSEESVESAIQLLRDRTVTGDLYGEFILSVEEESYLNYLRDGVLTTWRRVDFETPMPGDQVAITEEDWTEWMELAHTGPRVADRRRFERRLDTDGQILWSDEIQLARYREGYHDLIETRGPVSPGSETMTEVFLPTVAVPGFMSAARAILRTSTTPVVRCSIRLCEKDETTFLAWARQPFACVAFDLHVDDTHVGREVAEATVRELIDEALERDGTFYLTYGRAARISQVRAAYPQFEDFLRMKLHHDPAEIFQSD